MGEADWVDTAIAHVSEARRGAAAIADSVRAILEKLEGQVERIERAWSKSWIGYQAELYFGDFQPAPRYDIDWGGTPEGWARYDSEAVRHEIEQQAGVELSELVDLTRQYHELINETRRDIDVALAPAEDMPDLSDDCERLKQVVERDWPPMANAILNSWTPRQAGTRDQTAVFQGLTIPPHKRVAARLAESRGVLSAGEEMLADLDRIARRLGARVTAKRGSTPVSDASEGRVQPIGNEVFIVHGRDTETKLTVARFIDQLGLESVILHEQPNEGMTLVEKLIATGSRALFAVVVLSPDDVGGLADEKPVLKARARQNVIFEMGYFIGLLGRANVCAVVTAGLEKPSDIDGVVYVSMSGDWRIELARELRKAGMPADLNKAVELD